MNPQAAELRDYMSELSEEYWYAGWLIGLEYSLWYGVANGHFAHPKMSYEESQRLMELSDACGGWIIWDKKTDGEKWIPLEEWEEMYHMYNRGNGK